MRKCKACNQKLARWAGEKSDAWKRRVVCDTVCRSMLLLILPSKIVPCVGGCGRLLERRRSYGIARCQGCQAALSKANQNHSLHVLRHQARRYRIMLHTLGYTDEQFEELIEEIKGTYLCLREKPETRAARFDVAIDRRHRKVIQIDLKRGAA